MKRDPVLPLSESEAGGPTRSLRLPAFPVRVALSVFIVFHLFCVLLVPNSDNVVGARFFPWLQPYLLGLELTNTWSFFSPNPEPPIYIEYELQDAHGEVMGRGQWPEAKDPYFWRERQTRRITATDFMLPSEARIEKMMVSYLCHREPHPGSLRLWRVMETIPRPEEVVTGKRKVGDGVGTERKFVSHTFCETEGS